MNNKTTLSINKVEFSGSIGKSYLESHSHKLEETSFTFSFGESYIIDSTLYEGGWALSWIIGGLIEPTYGKIFRGNELYPLEQRRLDAWCVRQDEIKGWWGARQSVRNQIRYGLRNKKSAYFQTEEQVKEFFKLTPERYSRRLNQLSTERWRASCAIGFLNGRDIFCFPFIEPRLIEEYFDWLEPIIRLFESAGALVLVPTENNGLAKKLCNNNYCPI